MSEQTKELKLDASVIVDGISCLNELINNQDNARQLYALAAALKPVFNGDWPLYLTGIGKPGYVAQKQAASLKSIRIDAQFIDATLAGHGDLGPVPMHNGSMLIALSKSGCSSELYGLFKVLKQMRPACQIVLICMSNDKQFETVSACPDIDFAVRFQVDPKELDGFGIVPTTSNLLFEAILSTAFANAIKDTLGFRGMCKRLQESHPSGTLYNKVTALLENFDNEQSK